MPDHTIANLPTTELMHRLVTQECHASFRILVERHAKLVHAVAWRQTQDFHAAEDISQNVFCALLREASKVRGCTLAAWLDRRTIYESAHWRRAEWRRKRREQSATQVTEPSSHTMRTLPELDQVLDALPLEDRQILLLRHSDQLDWRTIGSQLGLTEDTAQKRGARALERLRLRLARRGIVKSSSALAGVLAILATPPAGAASSAKFAAAALVKSTASVQPTWTLVGLLGNVAIPLLFLTTGWAIPKFWPQATASGSPTSAQQAVSPLPSSMTATGASPPMSPRGSVDITNLRSMIQQSDSPLDRLRVRRELENAGAEQCQTLMAEASQGPITEVNSVLRQEIEQRWITADPRHAAIVGGATEASLQDRAIRYLAGKDFPAAEKLAAETAAIFRKQSDNPYRRELVEGLASADVMAALAYVDGLGLVISHPGVLAAAADSQPEAVAKLLRTLPGLTPDGYEELETWKKVIAAISRNNPRRAWDLFCSREFPKGHREQMSLQIFEAMQQRDPAALLSFVDQAPKSFEGWRVQALAKQDESKALAYVKQHPDAFGGLLETMIYPDPAAALKRWVSNSADPLVQKLWWSAASVRLAWLEMDLPAGELGKALPATGSAKAEASEIQAGMTRSIATLTEPPERFAELLGKLQTVDPDSASALAKSIPEQWGEAGAKIRADWLRQTGAPLDEIERATVAGLTSDKIAQGYVELAANRLKEHPETALPWALSQTGEARIGALSGLIAFTKDTEEDHNIAQQAFQELLTAAPKDHPKLPNAVASWVWHEFERAPDEIDAVMQDLPHGALYDASAAGLSGKLVEAGEPAIALHWAAQIADPVKRQTALTQVLIRWCNFNQASELPRDAQEALRSLPISAQSKQRLMEKFQH